MIRRISRRTFLKEAARETAVAGAVGTSLVLQGCASRKDFDLVIKDTLVYDSRVAIERGQHAGNLAGLILKRTS